MRVFAGFIQKQWIPGLQAVKLFVECCKVPHIQRVLYEGLFRLVIEWQEGVQLRLHLLNTSRKPRLDGSFYSLGTFRRGEGLIRVGEPARNLGDGCAQIGALII